MCKIVHDRGKWLGLRVEFRGEYLTDHLERSLIRPIGCEIGIGLGAWTSTVEERVSQADPPPWSLGQTIVATWTATIVRSEPGGLEFHKDDGIRLNVIGVSDVSTVDKNTNGVRP
jgi:hypothetical protein